MGFRPLNQPQAQKFRPIQQQPSPVQFKPIQQNFAQKWDTALRNFSQATENLPKANFADKVQNPVGRFLAGIAQNTINIPSKAIGTVFGGYGEDAGATLKRAARAAEVGLDIGSLIGGGGTVKALATAEKGFKPLVAQGIKTGALQGAGYGAGYGATGAIQNNQPVLPSIEKNALLGGVTGGIVGGAAPLVGKLTSRATKPQSRQEMPILPSSGTPSLAKAQSTIPYREPSTVSGKSQLSPLHIDAKKYKTPEEFVKAQGDTVYHGTNADFSKFDVSKARNTLYGKGLYFADNPEVTKQYGKKTIEAVLDRNSVLKLNEPLTPAQKESLRSVMKVDEWDWGKNPTGDFVWGRLSVSHKNPEEILKKAGIKAVQHEQHTANGINKNFIVFDDTAVKTKSQLTDIWKESHSTPQLGTNTQGTKQRGFAKTISESKLTSPEVKNLLKDSTYTPQKNDVIVSEASRLVKNNINQAIDVARNGKDNLSVATASELIKYYQNQGNHDAAAEIAKQAAEKLTEAGRFVQAASLYNKLTPEGLIRYAQKELQKEGINLTGEQANMLHQLATDANKATGEQQIIKTTQMLQKVQELIPSKFVDKLTTVWKAGLLTNPTTHMANLLGNTTMTALETAKDYPAVLLDKFASVFTGKRTKALPSGRALASGAYQGGKKAFTFLKTGVDVDQTLGKLDYKQVNLPPVLKQYTQAIFRTLGATDKVFKESLFKKSLHELAVVDGINQGLKGKKLAEHVVNLYEKPSISMVEQATQDALYGTFNNQNVLSNALNQLKRSESGVTRGLTELVAPFGRTPANIGARILDYSPYGFGKAVYEGAKGRGQRAVVEDLGRALVGSGIIGTGYALGKQGAMTGNYPTNPTEQALWQATGKQPGAINVGGEWQSLNRISPVGNLLSTGSALANMGRIKPENVPGAMLGAVGKNLLGQTYLQGVSGAINAVQDPNRYGQNWASAVAQSVIPSVIGATARANDPLQRQTNSIGESVQARIPFLRNQLLPKVDVFGNTLKQESNPLLNPFNTTSQRDNIVTNEIGRLYNEYAGATLGHPSKTANIGQGLKIDMTPQEYTTYEQQTGGVLGRLLDNVIRSENYRQASDYDRANAINQVISNVRKVWVLQNAKNLQNKSQIIQQVQDIIRKKTPNPYYK